MEVSKMISKALSHEKTKVFRWTAGLLLSCLAVVSILKYGVYARKGSDVMIHQDIIKLQKIFNQIHKDCFIASFAHIKNPIDFLTVISFVGSQVGPMNLAFAKNWKGAYLKVNPKIQQQLYAVLKNKQGYFIVPGDGVKLNNGKVIGKDIVLDYDADMGSLIGDSDALLAKSGVLAAPIQIGSQSMSSMMQYPELFQTID